MSLGWRGEVESGIEWLKFAVEFDLISASL
jgi:hypothetical protein